MLSYCKYENRRLVIGNDQIERSIDLSGGAPVSEYILNKSTGYYWRGSDRAAMFNVCGFDFSGASIKFNSYESDNGGLSERHLCAELAYVKPSLSVTQRFTIYDGSPFISTSLFIRGHSDGGRAITEESAVGGIERDRPTEAPAALPVTDTIDRFAISPAHLRVRAIVLTDKSDGNDCYVHSSDEIIYDHIENNYSGSIFILDAYQSGEGLMVVKEAPCIASQLSRSGSDLRVRSRASGYVDVCGSGIADGEVNAGEELELYGVTVGVGSPTELTRAYKRHYSKVFLGSGRLFAMSNTWGDRSRDAALCESFMLRERECAEKIGVDIMQIDDGWQKGLSANSAKKAGKVWSSGFYREDPHFWDVSAEKFPSGLSPLMSDKVELALWFSADGDNDYANSERDAGRLAELSRQYGVRQFKLDGITLKSKLGERHIREFLRLARKESGTDLTFNLDITAGVRLGYLPEKEVGTIFVENRYTDFVNYYPHATLKNLWMLSELFPARKFQFELLNNLRNADKYEAAAPGDELAPANYDIDWLFASVMVSNPLFWMEMQHLSAEQTERLARIVSVWKNERDRLYEAEVEPIGSLPDGYAFTGFDAKLGSGGYLILLRESGEARFAYDGISEVEVLASSGGFEYKISGGELSVGFEKPRSYAFLKYRH